MRLWSLHPRYLDVKGLTACWREALLAQQVLRGATKAWRRHPQLARFQALPDPVAGVAAYLRYIHAEAERRGYQFDRGKIASTRPVPPLPVTRGQLHYELAHLRAKLRERDRRAYEALAAVTVPEPHPLFYAVEGPVEAWEIVPEAAQQHAGFSG
jgi:hypothetical protein